MSLVGFFPFCMKDASMLKLAILALHVAALMQGAPQGTQCGPNVFKLLINDLRFDSPYAKYVDNTTIVSVSDEPTDSSLQSASAELCE
jgi:hypothetical protein